MSAPTITRHLITPPDLGDITGVKVGDRVAVLHVERGRLVVKGWRPVTEVTAYAVWMKRDKFLKANGGACSYAMHRQDTAHFYYSANPAHVAEAVEKAHAEKVTREAAQAAQAARVAAAADIGALLGDGERYTETYGEAYYSSEATNVLAERLTVEQIETLKSWMKI